MYRLTRWIGGMLLMAALALGACAPTQQGADETASPTSAATASPAPEAEAVETPEANETPEPAETPYDY